LSSLTPPQAALVLREAIAALSRRMPVEPGVLVPEASTEHLARLADKLERAGGAGGHRIDGIDAVDAGDVTALDTWIRAADGFTLHPDAAEVEARAALGRQLRAVRALVAPEGQRLTTDPRDV
jgi:hypothetical protein